MGPDSTPHFLQQVILYLQQMKADIEHLPQKLQY